MNTDDLRLLAARAEGVEGRQADRLTELHGRIRTARRRRATVGAVTAATVIIALVAGGAALSGKTDRTLEPVEQNTPSPPAKTSTVEEPAGQKTVIAEIAPGDIGGWELKASRTNLQPGFEQATELTLTVETPSFTGFSPMPAFCHGDPNTWWVMTIDLGGVDGGRNPDGSMADGSRGTFGTCSQDGPTAVPIPTAAIEPGRRREGPTVTPLRMFVTGPLSAVAQRCLGTTGAASCPASLGLSPLAQTDATFGFGVYEPKRGPIVLDVSGFARFEALSIGDGVEYLIDRAVVSADGAPRLVVRLPATDRRRVVGYLSRETPATEDCAAALGHPVPTSADEERAQMEEFDRRCLTDLELRIDGELPLRQKHDFSFVQGQVVLPPGDAHDVTVTVTRNDPRNVRYALFIWEERR